MSDYDNWYDSSQNNLGSSPDEIARDLDKNRLLRYLKRENNKLYLEYKHMKGIILALNFVVFILGGLGILSLFGARGQPDAALACAIFAVSFFAALLYRNSFVDKTEQILETADNEIVAKKQKQEDQMDKIEELVEEINKNRGNPVINYGGKGSMFFTNSKVDSPSIVNNEKDDNIEKALTDIEEIINVSNNEKAREVYEKLSVELRNGRDPTTVESYWRWIVELVPQIASLTSATSTIMGLFRT
jgi:hypothetical protein